MTKRMLIDATHREETRVVVLNGNRLEEFDFETSTKKQLKGNIYLAKVTRVEPSLQAAFVDFGGNRHGFLAFNEIHPDYYQIPVADRMALLKEEEALAAEALEVGVEVDEDDAVEADPHLEDRKAVQGDHENAHADDAEHAAAAPEEESEGEAHHAGRDADAAEGAEGEIAEVDDPPAEAAGDAADDLEELGGEDAVEIRGAQRRRERPRRQRYKIQEVIKRRQIILVQVVKEERGNKGAALTTYLSLAGRYCVLMPNTTKGGGISRKISSPKDRNRLKGFLSDLEIPDGVAVILRTAAIERSKAEIRRDFEYLIRIWQLVRETTLNSIAPTLVYEEANLIKRSIRDLYSKDIDEVMVEGEEGYKTAKDFMRMLMPSHAKRVQPYKDPSIPLFQRYQVEPQIDAMHSPEVKLKSGGYIVINPTEALVSIDVNSGRATRERNIEETAYKTNLEAAEEIARQLRLRDLAGLIVIDFIDMMESRNQHTVERRLKDAMRSDRARIQIGRISPFGLLELSRQRLRPSLLEASTAVCPHCEGTGLIRSTESAALHVLRAVEEEGIRRRSGEIHVEVATPVALYILNEKRSMLTEIEERHGFHVFVTGDDSLVPPAHRIERVAEKPSEARPIEAWVPEARPVETAETETETETEDEDEDERPARVEAAGEEKPSRRRRSRRRRPRRAEEAESEAVETSALERDEREASDKEAATETEAPSTGASGAEAGEEQGAEKPKRRRRGRRGGRRQARAKAAATTREAADTASEDEGTPAETVNGAESAGEAEGAGAGAAAEAAEGTAPPKRGRGRSGAKAGEPEPESAAAEAAASGAEQSAAQAAEGGAEKPAVQAEMAESEDRRQRRVSSGRTVDTEAPKETEVEHAARARGNGSDGQGNGKETPAPAEEPAGEEAEPAAAAPPPQPPAEERPPAPKRQGWWNRFTQ
jgi:ribonuclease E